MTATATSAHPVPPLQESCPWCGQTIPHEKLDEIRARIQTHERARTRSIERRLDEEMKTRLAQAADAHKAELKKIEQDNAVITARIQKDAAAALATAKAEAAKKHENELKAAHEAKNLAEAALTNADFQHEQELASRLGEQREALAQHHLQQLNAEKSRAFQDRQKLEEQLSRLQRQLQKKTNEELGEGAEVDLFEELKGNFSGDDIKRVKRGEPGADIVHTVMDSGRVCGTIVYDSKNRTAWRNDYVTKLHSDQLAAKADHAILATAVFPAGRRQLHVQDGVVVANPARVIALVSILRKHLIHLATMRLSDHARTEKMAALYDFVTSERCDQLFSQLNDITDDMLELEVKEKRAHDSTWKKRGGLIQAAAQAQATLSAEIDRIVTAPVLPLQKAT